MQEQSESDTKQDAAEETTSALYWVYKQRPMPSDLRKIFAERPGDFGFKDVDEVKQAIYDLHASEDRQNQLSLLFDAIVQMHLDTFLARCAPSPQSQGQNRRSVAELVSIYMESGRFDRVRALISDISELGIEKAVEKNTKIEPGNKFGHIFAGTRSIAEILIIISMFGAVDSGFQTLVISSIVLIYAGLSYGLTSLNTNNILTAFNHSIGLQRIRFLLKDKLAGTDEIHESQDEIIKKMRKAEIRHYIFTAKVAVIEIIGIFEILRTII